MKFVVKNTTKFGFLDLVCPHSCRGCGQLGDVLCDCCKKNLFLEIGGICPLCKRKVARNDKNDTIMKCEDCNLPFRAVLVGGWREGTLAKLIKDYKYQSVRAIGAVLVELLDEMIREEDLAKLGVEEMVVVPLPTIGKHVRQRGFDHTLGLAKKLAKRRGWKCEKLLRRKTDTVQVGSTMKQRQHQAEQAYEMMAPVDKRATYLLLDDIWTTGASALAAARVLRQAGAKKVIMAVLATGQAREEEK